MAVQISHSKLDLKAYLQNKRVVRRLFGSILISYARSVITSALVLVSGQPTEFVKP